MDFHSDMLVRRGGHIIGRIVPTFGGIMPDGHESICYTVFDREGVPYGRAFTPTLALRYADQIPDVHEQRHAIGQMATMAAQKRDLAWFRASIQRDKLRRAFKTARFFKPDQGTRALGELAYLAYRASMAEYSKYKRAYEAQIAADGAALEQLSITWQVLRAIDKAFGYDPRGWQ